MTSQTERQVAVWFCTVSGSWVLSRLHWRQLSGLVPIVSLFLHYVQATGFKQPPQSLLRVLISGHSKAGCFLVFDTRPNAKVISGRNIIQKITSKSIINCSWLVHLCRANKNTKEVYFHPGTKVLYNTKTETWSTCAENLVRFNVPSFPPGVS